MAQPSKKLRPTATMPLRSTIAALKPGVCRACPNSGGVASGKFVACVPKNHPCPTGHPGESRRCPQYLGAHFYCRRLADGEHHA